MTLPTTDIDHERRVSGIGYHHVGEAVDGVAFRLGPECRREGGCVFSREGVIAGLRHEVMVAVLVEFINSDTGSRGNLAHAASPDGILRLLDDPAPGR
ncbi:hypothetical protein ACPXCG_00135 [Gordonia sp. DT218]|uniref:hypothetical protein n=1 Tax=unclassified Gordonia (in: high G+C Gram-positive bacteria) TaxID=2657482 RepID=UPI003CF667A5